MNYFGVKLDDEKNRSFIHYPSDISEDGSDVRILVVKTNEESAIAKRAYKLMRSQRRIEECKTCLY
jgi:acetate kinase